MNQEARQGASGEKMEPLAFAVAVRAEEKCELGREVRLRSDADGAVELGSGAAIFLAMGIYSAFLRMGPVTAECVAACLATLFVRARVKRQSIVFASDEIRVVWAFTTGTFGYDSVKDIRWLQMRRSGIIAGVVIDFPHGRYFRLPLTAEAANGVAMGLAMAKRQGVDTSAWLPIEFAAQQQ